MVTASATPLRILPVLTCSEDLESFRMLNRSEGSNLILSPTLSKASSKGTSSNPHVIIDSLYLPYQYHEIPPESAKLPVPLSMKSQTPTFVKEATIISQPQSYRLFEDGLESSFDIRHHFFSSENLQQKDHSDLGVD